MNISNFHLGNSCNNALCVRIPLVIAAWILRYRHQPPSGTSLARFLLCHSELLICCLCQRMRVRHHPPTLCEERGCLAPTRALWNLARTERTHRDAASANTWEVLDSKPLPLASLSIRACSCTVEKSRIADFFQRGIGGIDEVLHANA